MKKDRSIELRRAIINCIKTLSKNEYEYLNGLVPIHIVEKKMKELGYDDEEIYLAIYCLFLFGDLIPEKGDSKINNFKTPYGYEFYYTKLNKEVII